MKGPNHNRFIWTKKWTTLQSLTEYESECALGEKGLAVKPPLRAASLRHSLTVQRLPLLGINTSRVRYLNTILTMITLAGIQKILTGLQMSNKFGRNCGCRHIVAATFLQCAPLPCIIDDSQQNVRECRPIGSTSYTIREFILVFVYWTFS